MAENCVKTILCGLSAATRRALQTLINRYVDILTAEKAALSAQAIVLNILAVGPTALNLIAQQALREVTTATSLLPTSVLSTPCTSWGDVPNTISKTVDDISAKARQLANQLERNLSFGDELQAKSDQITADLLIYTQVQNFLESCS